MLAIHRHVLPPDEPGGAHPAGALRSAPLLIHSVDFGPIAEAQHDGRWDDAGTLLADSARRLHAAGAYAGLLGSQRLLARGVAPELAAPIRVEDVVVFLAWTVRLLGDERIIFDRS